MPRYREAQIRFIRRKNNGGAETNPLRDDVLRISRLGVNAVRVVYTERTDDAPVVDVLTCNNYSLLSYLYRLFWLTTLDEDPFKSVQFFIPGFPTFLLEVATLKQHVPYILELVISLCWNWPTIGANRSLSPVGGPQQTADGGGNGDNSYSG